MKFIKHPDSTMGIYTIIQEPDIFGRTEFEHVFNLLENPELAEKYLAWLAEGNTPEPWEATNGSK